VLEDASVALNPNQANYITLCMESIKGVSRKGKKKQRRRANLFFYHGAAAQFRHGFIITLS
jgi:hypothetical protein